MTASEKDSNDDMPVKKSNAPGKSGTQTRRQESTDLSEVLNNEQHHVWPYGQTSESRAE